MPSDIHSVCDIHSAFSGDCLSSSASAGATMHMYCGENAVRSRLLAISHGHVPISAMSRFSRVTPSAFSVEKGLATARLCTQSELYLLLSGTRASRFS